MNIIWAIVGSSLWAALSLQAGKKKHDYDILSPVIRKWMFIALGFFWIGYLISIL